MRASLRRGAANSYALARGFPLPPLPRPRAIFHSTAPVLAIATQPS